MNQVVTFTRLAHEGKSGESKYGKYWFRVFETAGGAKFQTLDVDLGDKIADSFGTAVDLTYEIEDSEKDGRQYQNNVIKSIKAANGNGHVTEIATGGVVLNPTAPSADRELRIMRQSALDRAINALVGGIGGHDLSKVKDVDLFRIADQFIVYFEQGSEAFGS